MMRGASANEGSGSTTTRTPCVLPRTNTDLSLTATISRAGPRALEPAGARRCGTTPRAALICIPSPT